MTTHLGVMVLYAALIAIVFGTLMRDEAAAQVRLASRIFVGLVGGAYLAAWFMFLIFG